MKIGAAAAGVRRGKTLLQGGNKSTHHTQSMEFEHSKISRLLSEESKPSLLPEFLLDLSSKSMKTINGGIFEAREVSTVEMSLEEEIVERPTFNLNDSQVPDEPKPLIKSENTSPVIGIDVSSVRVGESEAGTIYSLRGAIVWREQQDYNYMRCGPLTFYLNDSISRFLNGRSQTSNNMLYAAWSPLNERVLARLRNTLERWMQRYASSKLSKGIVLIDGSLTAGTPDNPIIYLIELLRESRENQNSVIGFSKDTRLCYSGKKITRLLDKSTAPSIMNIDRMIAPQSPSSPIKLMGRVYIAKLASGGLPFRVDIDRELPDETAIEALGQLINSDLVEQGYPETLRLAHILSTFTANEILAIQRHLTIEHGLRLTPKMNLRRSLFGPYGT